MASVPDPYSFSDLLHMGRSELFIEYTKVAEALATLHERIAFVKITGDPSERIELEGARDAMVEKKWLVLKLIDNITELARVNSI